MREGIPPGAEHGPRDGVAVLERARLVVHEPPALEPGHGQEPLGRQLGQHLRHADCRLVAEDGAIERGVPRFQIVVELLAQARRDLLQDLARLHRRVHARVQREYDLELGEVRLHGRLHVGILQLGGERRAIVRDRAVHLAQRGGRGRLRLEALEALGPVGPQLGHHAPAHEGRAHRRGLRLQLGQLLRVLGGQRLGDGGQELRHLHDRPLEAAQRRRQRRRIRGVVAVEAEQALARHARRHRTDVGADPHIARRASGEAVLFLVLLVVQGGPSLSPEYRVAARLRPVALVQAAAKAR